MLDYINIFFSELFGSSIVLSFTSTIEQIENLYQSDVSFHMFDVIAQLISNPQLLISSIFWAIAVYLTFIIAIGLPVRLVRKFFRSIKIK